MVIASIVYVYFIFASLPCSHCKITSAGQYWHLLHGEEDHAESKSSEKQLVSLQFHYCGMNHMCKFHSKNKKTNIFSQISSKENLPQDEKDTIVWKKVDEGTSNFFSSIYEIDSTYVRAKKKASIL